MDILKQLLVYALLAAGLWAAITYLPRLQRVAPEVNYYDIDGMKPYEAGYFLEPVTPAQLKTGDAVCFALGNSREKSALFGWIAGLPGQQVAIVKGKVEVDGKPAHPHTTLSLPDCGPFAVPAGHAFVVSSNHRYDSLANGPLPLTTIRGRIEELP